MAAPPELPGKPVPHAHDARYREAAVVIDCEGDTLVGIASIPADPGTRGVLIVVGGPQYRAGSHRQFVLLARDLAASGVPVLRFDYRGMGDSAGQPRDFQRVDKDISFAVGHLMAAVPSLRDVAIWGICDGATASAFYAATDPRVTGMVLLNPWVRTGDSVARATIRHYYSARLVDGALWKKILRGRFDFVSALRSFGELADIALRGLLKPPQSVGTLPDRLLAGVAQFRGRILVILSGQDLAAREFEDLARSTRGWKRALGPGRTAWRRLDPADHTFSCRAWRDQVAVWTREWIHSW